MFVFAKEQSGTFPLLHFSFLLVFILLFESIVSRVAKFEIESKKFPVIDSVISLKFITFGAFIDPSRPNGRRWSQYSSQISR